MLEEGVAYTTEPIPALRNPEYLARAANRHRQKMRPAEPTDLEFEIQEEHIPAGFLKSDVKVDGKRHLVFATQNMLNLMTRSKTWYVDGTFKVIKVPFTQLFSFHSFVQSGECLKQMPVAFVLMSGKWKRGIVVRGCSFHWAQCIWRKIQAIGLVPAYKSDSATHKLCRKFLALPYLPKEHIPAVFERLSAKASTPMLIELVVYIQINWIEGNSLIKNLFN